MGKVLQRAGGGGGEKIFLLLHGVPGTNITAICGTKVRTGVIGNDGILQLKLPDLGLWHVIAQSGAYGFEQDIKVYQPGVTEGWALLNKPFADCTPEEIQAVARSGLASEYWQVGDLHEIVLTTGETIYVQIAGFNHDVEPISSKPIPLTLIMKNCFKTTYQLNSINDDTKSWIWTTFRNTTLPSIKSSFPNEWQAIMTLAQKRAATSSSNKNIILTDDALWIPSEVEVTGSPSGSIVGEGSIYSIFTNTTNRIARLNGVVTTWWTRSPSTTAKNHRYIEVNGVAANAGATVKRGVRVGFCVG